MPAGTLIAVLETPLSVGPIDVALEPDAVEIKTLHVAHKGGGAIDVSGHVELVKGRKGNAPGDLTCSSKIAGHAHRGACPASRPRASP